MLEKHKGFLSKWGLGMRLAFLSVTSGHVYLSCIVSAEGFHMFFQAMADVTGYEIRGHLMLPFLPFFSSSLHAFGSSGFHCTRVEKDCGTVIL